MTVTDAMADAAIPAWFETLDDFPTRMRAAIEAALAVQPVPTDASLRSNDDSLRTNAITDAEIEKAIDKLIGEAHVVGQGLPTDGGEYAARASLLRMIAAQRSAARREALEAVREKLDGLRKTIPPTPDYDSSERMIYGCGYDVGLIDIKRHIDAELAKEAE